MTVWKTYATGLRRVRAILCLLAWAGMAPAGEPELPALSVAQLRQLLPELRQGGHVIYFRHGATRGDQMDRAPVIPEDCATQRNLSDAGRRQAETVGKAFRRMRIPVGRILSSPYCRARDTARWSFGEPEVVPALSYVVGLQRAQRQAMSAELRSLLAELPSSGNTVLLGHAPNLHEAVGHWPKPEGVIVLFRPDGQGGWSILGRVAVATWGLAADAEANGAPDGAAS